MAEKVVGARGKVLRELVELKMGIGDVGSKTATRGGVNGSNSKNNSSVTKKTERIEMRTLIDEVGQRR